MKRLILVGSPRTEGRSAHLAEMLFEANIDEFPGDELFLVPISEVDVESCIGCDGCREKSEVIVKDDSGEEVSLWKHRCVFDDDMQTIYDLLDDADEVVVVCPVYFSGAPAPFKCLLDRLQPYFWSDMREGQKRPVVLHVLGEGGDPHGFDALVSEVRSALAVAGFRLERLLDWVGCIDEAGEITAEAKEIPLVKGESGSSSAAGFGNAAVGGSACGGAGGAPSGKSHNRNNKDAARDGARGSGGKERPKLDLSAQKGPMKGKPAKGYSGKGGQQQGKPHPKGKQHPSRKGNPRG